MKIPICCLFLIYRIYSICLVILNLSVQYILRIKKDQNKQSKSTGVDELKPNVCPAERSDGVWMGLSLGQEGLITGQLPLTDL